MATKVSVYDASRAVTDIYFQVAPRLNDKVALAMPAADGSNFHVVTDAWHENGPAGEYIYAIRVAP